ncbi:MAG: metal-dependent hydrolase [Acidimicrobiia bacterium]
MLLWHLGMTTLAARYVFRDPNMDLRWLALGALLPDIVDKPIGAIFWNDVFHNHRVYAHSLLLPVLALAGAMIFTRRRSVSRKAAIVVVLGWFLHLILDGVWASPGAFLWPLFGFDFPRVAGSDFGTLVGNMISNPLVWLGEVAGAAYLIYLWRSHLGEPGAVARFLRDGKVTHSLRVR